MEKGILLLLQRRSSKGTIDLVQCFLIRFGIVVSSCSAAATLSNLKGHVSMCFVSLVC